MHSKTCQLFRYKLSGTVICSLVYIANSSVVIMVTNFIYIFYRTRILKTKNEIVCEQLCESASLCLCTFYVSLNETSFYFVTYYIYLMLFILNYFYFSSNFIVFKVYFYTICTQTFVVTPFTYVIVNIFAQNLSRDFFS